MAQSIERSLAVVNAHSALLIPLDRHQASKPLTTEWVANSILSASGAPFIYAVLTSSALYSQATGAANPLDVLHYKTETIREIHTLFDNPRRRVDDSNIAAVFMLLCLEESQLVGREDQEDAEWSELQRRKHLNGLKKMIELRGGLAALGRNRCLQTFILMWVSPIFCICILEPRHSIYISSISYSSTRAHLCLHGL